MKYSLVIKKLETTNKAILDTSISFKPYTINILLNDEYKSHIFFKSILNLCDSKKKCLFYDRDINLNFQYIGYYSKHFDIYKDLKVKQFFKYSNSFYKNNYKDNIKRLLNIFSIDSETLIKDLDTSKYELVKIIDSIYHKPELLLLDNPYNCLDNDSINILNEEILNLKNDGSTIIISNNSLEYLYYNDTHYYIFSDNKLIDLQTLKNKRFEVEIEKDIEINFKLKLLSFNKKKNSNIIEYIGPSKLLLDELKKNNIKILSIRVGDKL